LHGTGVFVFSIEGETFTCVVRSSGAGCHRYVFRLPDSQNTLGMDETGRRYGLGNEQGYLRVNILRVFVSNCHAIAYFRQKQYAAKTPGWVVFCYPQPYVYQKRFGAGVVSPKASVKVADLGILVLEI
jgi:hypothetical protein